MSIKPLNNSPEISAKLTAKLSAKLSESKLYLWLEKKTKEESFIHANAKNIHFLFVNEPLFLQMIVFQMESYIVNHLMKCDVIPELILKINEVVHTHGDFLNKREDWISGTQIMIMVKSILLIAPESRLFWVENRESYDKMVKSCIALLIEKADRVFVPSLDLKRMPETSKLVHVKPYHYLQHNTHNIEKSIVKEKEKEKEKEADNDEDDDDDEDDEDEDDEANKEATDQNIKKGNCMSFFHRILQKNKRKNIV